TANPVIPTVPQMWVLSTSVRNAKMAAKLGIGYTFGLFPLAGIDKLDIGIQAAKTYREEFKPSAFMPEPRVSIAPFVVVAETNEQAEAYAESLDLWLLGTDNFVNCVNSHRLKQHAIIHIRKKKRQSFKLIVPEW